MHDIACELAHSVEAAVSVAFAWSWRADVSNWDDPPATFQLDGAFAAGSWGSTFFPGREALRWLISDVKPGRAFTLELPLDQAVLSFEWTFEALSDERTRITQRIVLRGDNAAAYVSDVRAGFGATLVEGMQRIADAMTNAARMHAASSGRSEAD